METAADYKCHLLVFPEYFTIQLLTLGNIRRPIREQVRDLAGQAERFTELMSGLARRHQLPIVGGTIPVVPDGAEQVYNQSMFFGPGGGVGVQQKLHMTRFETEDWIMSPGSVLRVFETVFGRVAIALCYDVEFPEIARAAAREAVNILVVPSCTDDRQPMVPAVSLNYGQASILTPSDVAFSRDGILAEGNANQEMMVIGELNLKTILETRTSGTVLPLHGSQRTGALVARPEVVQV